MNVVALEVKTKFVALVKARGEYNRLYDEDKDWAAITRASKKVKKAYAELVDELVSDTGISKEKIEKLLMYKFKEVEKIIMAMPDLMEARR